MSGFILYPPYPPEEGMVLQKTLFPVTHKIVIRGQEFPEGILECYNLNPFHFFPSQNPQGNWHMPLAPWFSRPPSWATELTFTGAFGMGAGGIWSTPWQRSSVRFEVILATTRIQGGGLQMLPSYRREEYFLRRYASPNFYRWSRDLNTIQHFGGRCLGPSTGWGGGGSDWGLPAPISTFIPSGEIVTMNYGIDMPNDEPNSVWVSHRPNNLSPNPDFTPAMGGTSRMIAHVCHGGSLISPHPSPGVPFTRPGDPGLETFTDTGTWPDEDFVCWLYSFQVSGYSINTNGISFIESGAFPLPNETRITEWPAPRAGGTMNSLQNFARSDALFQPGQRGVRVISERWRNAPWERYPHLV